MEEQCELDCKKYHNLNINVYSDCPTNQDLVCGDQHIKFVHPNDWLSLKKNKIKKYEENEIIKH